MEKPKKTFFERLTGAINMDTLHDSEEVHIPVTEKDGDFLPEDGEIIL